MCTCEIVYICTAFELNGTESEFSFTSFLLLSSRYLLECASNCNREFLILTPYGAGTFAGDGSRQPSELELQQAFPKEVLGVQPNFFYKHNIASYIFHSVNLNKDSHCVISLIANFIFALPGI